MKENEIRTTRILSPEESLPDIKSLTEMIDEKRFSEFRSTLEKIPAADISELLGGMPKEYYAAFYRLLTKELAAEVFVEMDSRQQRHIIDFFTDTELSAMLEELYLDDTVDMIEEMPATVVKRIIRNSSRENRAAINRLLKYPKGTAGTIMTTEYVRLTADMTVEAALTHVRRVAIDKETIYTCYVTDEVRRLIGIVTAKELLISSLDAKISDIMESSVIFVNTTDDKEDAARKLERYGFLALPVVDGEGRLVGIVTVDDAIDVLKEAVEEDFAKMAAITPSEHSYLEASAFELWRARIPWLLLLMISATFSSTILGRFEAALPAVLLLFVPMLMDTGGNSGGQSSVTVIRALSVGELRFSDTLRVLWKEMCVGVGCGVALGAVAFGKVILVDRLFMNNQSVTVAIAAAVALAMAITIVVAKLVGTILPIAAKRVGFDPAVMASPFITTVVDILALLLYFVIATVFISA